MPVEQFKERMDQTIREIAPQKRPARGSIYLPGEMEWERREKALAEGIDCRPTSSRACATWPRT